MCFYSGHRDPSRTTTVELEDKEILWRVKKIAKPKFLVEGEWKFGMLPYDRVRMAQKVRFTQSLSRTSFSHST